MRGALEGESCVGVRRHFAVVLAAQKEHDALVVLAQRDPDARVRVSAISLVVQIARDLPSFWPVVGEALEDVDDMKVEVLWRLDERTPEEFREKAAGLLDDPSLLVRETAAEILARGETLVSDGRVRLARRARIEPDDRLRRLLRTHLLRVEPNVLFEQGDDASTEYLVETFYEPASQAWRPPEQTLLRWFERPDGWLHDRLAHWRQSTLAMIETINVLRRAE